MICPGTSHPKCGYCKLNFIYQPDLRDTYIPPEMNTVTGECPNIQLIPMSRASSNSTMLAA